MPYAGGMVEIFLFILVAGLLANFIGASVHEGIFVGALVRCLVKNTNSLMPAKPANCVCSIADPGHVLHVGCDVDKLLPHEQILTSAALVTAYPAHI